jgi:hypothetical protein
MRLNARILKEMIRETLNELEAQDPTKLASTATTAGQFRTAGMETAKIAQQDPDAVDKVELTYIKQIQDFLMMKARQADLKQHKMSIQTLIQRLDKIIKPDAPEQGEQQ